MNTKRTLLVLPIALGALLLLGASDPASAGTRDGKSYNRSYNKSHHSYPTNSYRYTQSRSYYYGQSGYYYSAPKVVVIYVTSDRNCHSSRPVVYTRSYSHNRNHRSHR